MKYKVGDRVKLKNFGGRVPYRRACKKFGIQPYWTDYKRYYNRFKNTIFTITEIWDREGQYDIQAGDLMLTMDEFKLEYPVTLRKRLSLLKDLK